MRRSFYWMAAIIPFALAACSTPTAPTPSAQARRVGTRSATISADTLPPGVIIGVTIGGSTH
jgi:hypothetical protein